MLSKNYIICVNLPIPSFENQIIILNATIYTCPNNTCVFNVFGTHYVSNPINIKQPIILGQNHVISIAGYKFFGINLARQSDSFENPIITITSTGIYHAFINCTFSHLLTNDLNNIVFREHGVGPAIYYQMCGCVYTQYVDPPLYLSVLSLVNTFFPVNVTSSSVGRIESFPIDTTSVYYYNSVFFGTKFFISNNSILVEYRKETNTAPGACIGGRNSNYAYDQAKHSYNSMLISDNDFINIRAQRFIGGKHENSLNGAYKPTKDGHAGI